MQFMSTGTGTNHCCGSMANAFARLVTPQPNCRLILLLLSYLAAPVTIQAHSHNHCRNICLDFSLYHLSDSRPQFPARIYQCPMCQCQFLWILAQITLLTLNGAEANLLCCWFSNVREREEFLWHELLQFRHWHSNLQLRKSGKVHCKVAPSNCHSCFHPRKITLLVTGWYP